MIKAWFFLLLCYLSAFAVAWMVAGICAEAPLLLKTFYADVAATIVVFAFSTGFRNASFYDPYWSLAPLVMVIYWIIQIPIGENIAGVNIFQIGTTRLLLIFSIGIWGIRLTGNWFRRWTGFSDEDWRYSQLHIQTGRWYPWVNLAGIHLFPTVMVFAGMLPAWFILQSGVEEINGWMMLASLVALGGVVMEWLADEQLNTFRKTNSGGTFLKTGLWKFLRHPNYLGEILFWYGLALMAIAVDSSGWWTAAGALLIHLMFLFISIPMMDKRMKKRRPLYAEWMQETASLLPKWNH